MAARIALGWLIVATAFSGATTAAVAESDLGPVDFRYTLPWWQTAICLPDDPDKALAGKEGQLLFDFGGGGVRNFGLWAQPDLAEGTIWKRQQTISARAPILQTWKESGGVQVLEETFVTIPKPVRPDHRPKLERLDGDQRLSGWTKPGRAFASVFTGVEVAYDGTIQFRYPVPAGGKVTVVFGLCEGWHKEPGKRPLVLQVEGQEPRTVDPVQDFGPNHPGVYKLVAEDRNRDGRIKLSVGTPENTEDHNAILNALWIFEGTPPPDEEIIHGEADGLAQAQFPANDVPERRAVVLMTLKNTTNERAVRHPVLRLKSPQRIRLADDGASVLAGGATRILASSPIESFQQVTNQEWWIRLPAVTLPPGGERQVTFTLERHRYDSQPALSPAQARRARDAARNWWEHLDLPFETIQVPDAGIQGMLESCVRNIWQAREIKHGQPAFHVGPTVYRGLWVVDGSFLLESAALLGRGRDARAGVEYLLSFQKADGSFELIRHYWKENGIVLWAATRHAVLTQDPNWLRARWPDIRRVVAAMQRLRASTTNNPGSLECGLLPGGEVDGGISNTGPTPEFSNSYWCLGGLKSAIAAAHWLGEKADAAAWQKEYDDFLACLRKAMARDTLKDSHGNNCVPTMMANARSLSPQKGQWAFCQGVYPGQVFETSDPMALSQMAMLRATKTQGLVFDTGWKKDGIWTYFASFYAHAALWQGQSREAAEVLYDFARHACPTRVWREEQMPVGKGGSEVGDMPHNWASAEFVRLTTHLLELDRGDELHLLEGFPREWAAPGMITRLNGVATPFGLLHLEVKISANGQNARVKIGALKGKAPAKIVLHLEGLTGRAGKLEIPTGRDWVGNIPR